MPRQQHFRVTDYGLDIRGTRSYRQWEAYGPVAAALVKNAMWVLGDWLLYGEHKWPDRYAQAMSLTGLSYTTLTNAVWVARECANTRRRVLLEWWPHECAAPLALQTRTSCSTRPKLL